MERKASVVDPGRCQGCHPCPVVCPSSNLFKEEGDIPVVLPGCTGCGVCRRSCPYGAIYMV
ncbi:MAG: 4Fe-4S binding protein [Bacillota bacterium]